MAGFHCHPSFSYHTKLVPLFKSIITFEFQLLPPSSLFFHLLKTGVQPTLIFHIFRPTSTEPQSSSLVPSFITSFSALRHYMHIFLLWGKLTEWERIIMCWCALFSTPGVERASGLTGQQIWLSHLPRLSCWCITSRSCISERIFKWIRNSCQHFKESNSSLQVSFFFRNFTKKIKFGKAMVLVWENTTLSLEFELLHYLSKTIASKGSRKGDSVIIDNLESSPATSSMSTSTTLPAITLGSKRRLCSMCSNPGRRKTCHNKKWCDEVCRLNLNVRQDFAMWNNCVSGIKFPSSYSAITTTLNHVN